MRKNIYEVLKSGKIDLQREYLRLYALFYETDYEYEHGYATLEEIIDEEFCELEKKFVGRCLSLEDFNETYDYHFLPQPNDFSIEMLVDLAEYMYYFLAALERRMSVSIFEIERISEHIRSCMEDVGYTRVERDGITIFVEKNAAALSVAEIVEPELSYPVLEYNHFRLKGDIERKKAILKNMADDIELQRDDLTSINKDLASNLYQLLNKFIRHNNKNNTYISNMNDKEVETVYDEIYQMWLLAKLELQYREKRAGIKNLLGSINS